MLGRRSFMVQFIFVEMFPEDETKYQSGTE